MGACMAVEKGTKASVEGVYFPLDEAAMAPVEAAGTEAPAAGMWCSGCTIATKGMGAPEDGNFWTSTDADPVAVKKGAEAPESGLYCPTGKMCEMVPKGTKSAESGVFFPLGSPSYVAEVGTEAPGGGAWC